MTRKLTQPDSLELLLDTMCNTFGGIILIALLVALLARDTESRVSKSAVGPAEQRAEQLANDLHAAEAYIETLNTELKIAQTSERFTKARELKEIQEKHALLSKFRNDQQAQVQAASSPEAAAAAAQSLDRQIQDLQSQTAAQSANQTNAQQDIAQAIAKIAALQKQITAAERQRTRNLRTPREHSVTQDQFYFILKFGEIYPVHFPSDTTMSRNTLGLNWINKGPNTDAVVPIRGKGLNLARDKTALQTILSKIDPARYYVGFYVYSDSFEAFHAARQIALERGFEYGVNPLEQDEPIQTGGSSNLPAQ